MPRRPAIHTQADIARIIRAHRNEGVKVLTRLHPDGTIEFEGIGPVAIGKPQEEKPDKEIIL